MSEMSMFFKKNKKQKENTFFAATQSLCDENGKPLMWEIKPVSTKENNEIQDSCTTDVPVAGKPNRFRPRLNMPKYIGKLMAASIVCPDLLNAELQDDYQANTPEGLLEEMLDSPGEYNELAAFIQRYNGFDVSMENLKGEAKN